MKLLKSQSGFSIIELVIAMVLLSGGSAILWYGIKSSSRMDHLNKLHHLALTAAESDLESIRLLPKRNIHDTEYAISGAGSDGLLLTRMVFDSSKMVNTLHDIPLDEKLSPKELRKPLEVKVQVSLLLTQSDPAENFSPSSTDDHKRTLVSLTFKIPEYQWY